jgi:hypothetical protein
VKITSVTDRTRERALEISTEGKSYTFPYAKLRVVPSASDPITEIYPDPELGNEAFTYRLRSGAEDTVHFDAVLDVNSDPDYLQGLLFHQLTIEAIRGLEESRLGKRQAARQLGTSASQLYRLLDPGNTSKSLGQLLALLHLVGREVDVVVAPKSAVGSALSQKHGRTGKKK